jgi:hypothetical protein
MSHSSEHTAVIAPVASVAEAADAIRAGAQFVDPGTDEALASMLRSGGFAILDAQVIRVPASEIAGFGAEGDAEGDGADAEGDADAEGVKESGPGGRRLLVDVDGWGTPAAAGAVAAVCAWQGVRLIRTRHVAEVRRCLDMTESIIGIRPPALAVRGLG